MTFLSASIFAMLISTTGFQNAYAGSIGPNIEFTKTCTVIEPLAPGELNVHFEITNSGSSVAESIVLDDQQLEAILGFPGIFPLPLDPIDAGGSFDMDVGVFDLPAGTYSNTATVTFEDEDGDMMTVSDDAECIILPNVEVDIDIKPGSDPNSINLNGNGIIPVAILGTTNSGFDVLDVDVTTLAFGPNGAPPIHRVGAHFEDVNGDGYLDLVSHFRTQDTGIVIGNLEACITGLNNGIPFRGCDDIRTIPEPEPAPDP